MEQERNRRILDRLRIALASVTLLVGLLIAYPSVAAAEYSSTPSNGLITDGPVHAVAIGGDGKIYLGGAFGTIGPATGGGVVLDSNLANRDLSVAKVSGGAGDQNYAAGTVLTSVADGAGGWYVGGVFTSVGGAARTNLAHIRADGSVDPSFDPEPDKIVTHLSLSGSTLFVSGQFAHIGGADRPGLAGLNTADGSATAFNPTTVNYSTNCGIAAYGAHVFVCDTYSGSIDGQARKGLAELNASDGSLTSWDPQNTGNPQSIYISPTGVLYVGIIAAFNTEPPPSGSSQHPYHDAAAAFQIAADGTPTMLSFNPRLCCYGGISAFLQDGNTLYVGGGFSQDIIPTGNPNNPYNFYNRGNGAAFDLSNNYALLPWDPQANYGISAMVKVGGAIVIGGGFSRLGSTPRAHLAAVDPGTGAPLGADPGVDGSVSTIATDGTQVYVGGSLVTVGGTARQNLAVLNPDGTLASLAPAVDGEVDALNLSGSTLYAGGQFRNATAQGAMSSTARGHLAAFSTADGSLLPFDPEPDSTVSTLAADGTNLYAGGSFSHLGAPAHGDLAAFKLSDGSLLAGFDPKPDAATNALALAGGKLYAGGGFGTLTGVAGSPARSRVAAFDLLGLGLNPSFVPPTIDRDVYALAASSSAVYVGGAFDNVGSTYQPRLVALSAANGSLTGWNAQIGDNILSLALQGSTLYAGGAFTQAGGGGRINLAGLDTTTGAATTFAPQPDRDVLALATNASELVAGGPFQGVGCSLSPNLAVFTSTGGGTGTCAGAGGGGSGGGGESSSPPAGAAGLIPAPSTAITDGPGYFGPAGRVSFAFGSDTAGASFRCSLDGGAAFSCTSPYTTAALAPGAHSFFVQAVSPSGVADPGGASENFVLLGPGVVAPGAGTGAPTLANVSVTRTIKLGAKLRGRAVPGFRFRLSAPATVMVSFSRVVRTCRGSQNRCQRLIYAGRMRPLNERAGKIFLPFSGAVQGGELLFGAYQATIKAVAADGSASGAASADFSLVKRLPVVKRKPVKRHASKPKKRKPR